MRFWHTFFVAYLDLGSQKKKKKKIRALTVNIYNANNFTFNESKYISKSEAKL